MPFREIPSPSPNFDSTRRHERRGVCFHHSAETFTATLAILSDPARKVSYHCLIDLDGTRARVVADEHLAWHAGVSRFRGRERCNEFLLGCAFAGNTWLAPLTEPQLASALEWLEPRWRRHAWTLEAITDHRQIAPGRKDDLNPTEWARLHAAIAGRFGP